MMCPEVIFRYDGREKGILTDNDTLAFSSKTTYKMSINDYTVNTMKIQGEKYASSFKLSRVFEACALRMKNKNLKTNIVHNIHILGCMQIREMMAEDPMISFNAPKAPHTTILVVPIRLPSSTTAEMRPLSGR